MNGGGNIPDIIKYPFKEQALLYAFRYGAEITALRDLINVLIKSASAGDFDTAYNILLLAVSNLKSPPYYISFIPSGARIVNMYVISSEQIIKNDELKRMLVSLRVAEPTVVIIEYVYINEVEAIGVRLNYIINNGLFYTDTIPKSIVDKLRKMIETGELILPSKMPSIRNFAKEMGIVKTENTLDTRRLLLELYKMLGDKHGLLSKKQRKEEVGSEEATGEEEVAADEEEISWENAGEEEEFFG